MPDLLGERGSSREQQPNIAAKEAMEPPAHRGLGDPTEESALKKVAKLETGGSGGLRATRPGTQEPKGAGSEAPASGGAVEKISIDLFKNSRNSKENGGTNLLEILTEGADAFGEGEGVPGF